MSVTDIVTLISQIVYELYQRSVYTLSVKWVSQYTVSAICEYTFCEMSVTISVTASKWVSQILTLISTLIQFWIQRCYGAGGRRLIGCLKLQVICRKRATNYRALLRKMTYEDKASCGSWLPCTEYIAGPFWTASCLILVHSEIGADTRRLYNGIIKQFFNKSLLWWLGYLDFRN